MVTKIHLFKVILASICLVGISYSQTIDAYEGGKKEGKSFLDPSRLTVNHSVSFGMSSSSSFSGLKSQSLYTTMMTYKFSNPVTLHVNFGLPIHSTYASEFNLNSENLQSMEYFKNMPIDAHLTWRPSDNFAMHLSIIRNTGASYFNNAYGPYYGPGAPFWFMNDW